MASRRPGPPDGPNSVNTKLGICRKCGVTGFFELLVQCNLCGVSSEHSYCLNKMPKHDETVIWSCEECVPAASLKNLSLEPSGNSEQEEVKQPQENPSSIDDASKTVSPRENSEGEKVKQPQENPSSGDDASKAVSRRENSEGEKVKQPQENLSSGDDASKMVSRNLSLENHNHPYGLPVIDPVWRGCFDINNEKYGRLAAHISSKACLKVWEGANAMPPLLSLEMLSRADVWPKRFKISAPTSDSVALYFFLEEKERGLKFIDDLVLDMVDLDLALRAVFDNAELLIFSSNQLPHLYWRFRGKYYLWGVFKGKPASISSL